MTHEITIPALPCHSIDETLKFYVALGFIVTYQQSRPNTYACVKYGDAELHFFTLKDYEPANSYSTCLVIVNDIQALYATFTANLRQQYTKLPVLGIPRITRPNNKNIDHDLRFNVVDPGGNWIRFIQKASSHEETSPSDSLTTKFSHTLHTAELLVHSKGDYSAAAKMLDTALAPTDVALNTLQRIQALTLRAEVAAHLNDTSLALQLLTTIQQIVLTDTERAELQDELQRIAELAQTLV